MHTPHVTFIFDSRHSGTVDRDLGAPPPVLSLSDLVTAQLDFKITDQPLKRKPAGFTDGTAA